MNINIKLLIFSYFSDKSLDKILDKSNIYKDEYAYKLIQNKRVKKHLKSLNIIRSIKEKYIYCFDMWKKELNKDIPNVYVLSTAIKFITRYGSTEKLYSLCQKAKNVYESFNNDIEILKKIISEYKENQLLNDYYKSYEHSLMIKSKIIDSTLNNTIYRACTFDDVLMAECVLSVSNFVENLSKSNDGDGGTHSLTSISIICQTRNVYERMLLEPYIF